MMARKKQYSHQGGEELFNAYESLTHHGIEDIGFTDTVAELT